jgi:hypothetical protein
MVNGCDTQTIRKKRIGTCERLDTWIQEED